MRYILFFAFVAQVFAMPKAPITQSTWPPWEQWKANLLAPLTAEDFQPEATPWEVCGQIPMGIPSIRYDPDLQELVPLTRADFHHRMDPRNYLLQEDVPSHVPIVTWAEKRR